MTRYLCISVTLLDPLFHGKGDDKQPEWPPSPMRLFQALIAGSRTGCRNVEWSHTKAEAFRWLERQPPPVVITPPSQPSRSGCVLHVPNNDADKEFERQDRLTSKIAKPHWLLNGKSFCEGPASLYYLWPIQEQDWQEAEPRVRVLCREARNLFALGWGIDQAVGDGKILVDSEIANITGERWDPWRDAPVGQGRLRVPCEGSLQDIERAYERFVKRISLVGTGRGRRVLHIPPDKVRRFKTVSYIRRTALPPRQYAVFELPEGVAFRQEDVCVVAAMLRSLACRPENRQDFQEQFPDDDPEIYLAGHIKDVVQTPPRFSYLPLPSIGHEHADGMIRRLLIAEPHGGDGLHARWAKQRLLNQILHDEEGNERGVLMNLWRDTSRRILEYYTGGNKGSREWASVTPVILPGFDSRDRRRGIPASRSKQLTRAERLFLKAVEQANFPVDLVESFTLRKAPYWPGSAHPDNYRRPDYLDMPKNRRFPAWHVWIRFSEPVYGPLSLGAGRHCGLGLFAVWQQNVSQ